MSSVADRIRDGNQFVAEHIYALEAQNVNELYRAYLQAYRDLQRDTAERFAAMVTGDTWSVADIAAREALMAQIAQRLAQLDELAAEQVLGYGIAGYRAGYYGAGYVLDTAVLQALGLKPALIPLLPEMAVRAQLLAPYVGKQLGERFRDNRAQFELNMKNALVQSQIQGETIYQAQKRIAQTMGIAIGRRTKADRATNNGMFHRTETIARTELLRASNLGAQAVYEANQDVLKGWEWLTAKDDRVCPICAPLDGQQWAFGSKQLPPPAHVMCRCTTVPVLINQELERAIVGERVTFTAWAQSRGLEKNIYGQAYDLRGRKPPKKPERN